MKIICIFIPIFLLIIAGCTPATSLPTIDIEVALQQTLTAMVIDVGLPAIQLSDTEIPTQRSTDTPTPSPTEIPTNTPSQLFPDISGCIPPANIQEIGLVTNVVDGETIEVLINSQAFNVKYLGIAIPELNDPGQEGNTFGTSVTDKNRELVEGQIVTLVKDRADTLQDKYLFRYVFVSDPGELFMNHELVRLGYAIVDDSLPDISCSDFFQQAEMEARDNELGIWAPTPTSAPTSIPTQVPTQPPTPLPTPKPTKIPTNTSKPPIPYITMTPIPKTTVTCWVSPSTIPGATNYEVTFFARSSPPRSGLGFSISSWDPSYAIRRGCAGVDGDGDGIASCVGITGMIPFRKTVSVILSTSVGKCEAKFSTQ